MVAGNRLSTRNAYQFPLFKTLNSFKPNEGQKVERLKGWAEIDLAEVRAKLERRARNESQRPRGAEGRGGTAQG